MEIEIVPYYVYIIKDPISKKPFYVGKGSDERYLYHVNQIKKGKITENYYKDNKIRSILEKNLEPEYDILYCKTEKQAYDLEEKIIKKLGRFRYDDGGILTNVCLSNRPPDPTGRKHTEEAKRKIGNSNKGGKTANYGPDNGFYGKKHPPELQKEISRKISKATKGKPKSEKHKESLRNSFTNDRREQLRQRRIEYNKNLPESHRFAIDSANLRRKIDSRKIYINNLGLDNIVQIVNMLDNNIGPQNIYKQFDMTYREIWNIKKDLDFYKNILIEVRKEFYGE